MNSFIKKVINVSFFFIVFSAFAETYSIEKILKKEIFEELLQKGELKHTLEKDETELILMPETDFMKEKIVFQGGKDGEDPSYASEALTQSDCILAPKMKPEPSAGQGQRR